MFFKSAHSTTWLGVAVLALTACSGAGVSEPTPTTPTSTLATLRSAAVAPVAAASPDSNATLLLDYTPKNSPLTTAQFDAQASAAGLMDQQATYSTDSSNTIHDTGSTSLGNLQTQTTMIDSAVIVKFVASYSSTIYINVRGLSIGAYFNAGGGSVFDNVGSYTTIGGLSPNLTVGSTYYAKLDTNSYDGKTFLTMSFIAPDGTIVTTQKFTDSNQASVNTSGPSGVALGHNGMGVSRVIIYKGYEANDLFVKTISDPGTDPDADRSSLGHAVGRTVHDPNRHTEADGAADHQTDGDPDARGGQHSARAVRVVRHDLGLVDVS